MPFHLFSISGKMIPCLTSSTCLFQREYRSTVRYATPQNSTRILFVALDVESANMRVTTGSNNLNYVIRHINLLILQKQTISEVKVMNKKILALIIPALLMASIVMASTPITTCSSWGACQGMNNELTGTQYRSCDDGCTTTVESRACVMPSDGAAIPTSTNPIALNTFIGKYCYSNNYIKNLCFQRMKVFLISLKGTSDAQLYTYLGKIHGTFVKGWDWTVGKYRFTWFKTIAY